MRKFDPWPVFFRREWNRNWPFLVGFAITGAIIVKISSGVTDLIIPKPLWIAEEDIKNSPFAQEHLRRFEGQTLVSFFS
ncbi:hypothetical protein KSP40_PGU007550 [Platanthera guangdongensis]|uniref:Uncharacterized protein n=1 Tax=Platanthera guangdongensis TaxID=2320717 RepID=A0ABR2MUW1_9ASPA